MGPPGRRARRARWRTLRFRRSRRACAPHHLCAVIGRGPIAPRPPVDPALVLMSRSMLALRRPFAATLLVALFAVGLVSCALIAPVASPVPPHGEWPTHGGTNANARYSSLDQITRDNVRQLRIAWRWASPDRELMTSRPDIQTWANEATPLMVAGVLYVSTSASQVAAIDARTGRTLWVHDPRIWIHGTPANFGYVHRG